MKKKIFLSHQGDDKPIVRRVHAQLTKMGTEPFFDELNIRHGAVIPERIEKALATADVFVLFWSATAATSSYVTAERNAAWHKLHNQEERFLVVILDDTLLPPFLAAKRYINAKTKEGQSKIARKILQR